MLAVWSIFAVIGLAVIFEPLSIWPLAFVGYVPLLKICEKAKPILAFFVVFLIALILENIYFFWIYQVQVFKLMHASILAPYFAVYWAIWAAIASYILRARFSFVTTLIGISGAWVLMDYIMANLSFLAFPWNTLAHSQFDNKWLLQWASVFGEYGIAFIVISANVIIFYAARLSNRVLLVSASVVISIHIIGAFAYVVQPQPDLFVRIASLQPSFGLAKVHSEQDPNQRFRRLLDLTLEAASYDPTLVVWPEGALRGRGIASDSRFSQIQQLSSTGNVSILTGYAEDEKFTTSTDSKPEQYNQAILISSSGKPIIYSKQLLMPFAEYLPYDDIIDWPTWFVSMNSNLKPGDKAVEMRASGIVASTIICWENLFTRFVREGLSRDTNLIVDLVNDNWFGKTSAPYQHNIASIFRAVEFGVPVVISSNTGPSQIIDAHGKVIASASDTFKQTYIVADVPLRSTRTIYYYIGDVFVLFQLLFLVGLFVNDKLKLK
ncbi:apolipoprotein N-acyltransferase [Arenicella xantha]|uniref:Apolipoprotein N-acyltransferase n=1 Tax=Arenicella xantha TaxID=644221 RepID=A0A395JLA7_9GAMM|nr:apolipoprotein N-acyltransferase [Arenicella xantha]RBP50627.1 apolipoprotein N-acyltransferase [Arenicella xantha]